MPRYRKANGELVKSEVFIKHWFQIPIEGDMVVETHLVQPRVAEYMALLEEWVLAAGMELPKLPKSDKNDIEIINIKK